MGTGRWTAASSYPEQDFDHRQELPVSSRFQRLVLVMDADSEATRILAESITRRGEGGDEHR